MIEISIGQAVQMLADVSPKRRNLHMSGDPHYQPDDLKPYLGYDNRVGWMVIVEWFLLQALALSGIMPKDDAEFLTPELLARLLTIRTTVVTSVERKLTKHDVLALLRLMREILPVELHRWLHVGATSYDIIATAYALQAVWTYKLVFVPQIKKVDVLWRRELEKYAEPIQNTHTHLQVALPGTPGFWLATVHNRFYRTAFRAGDLAREIPGKFTGPAGTSALIRARFPEVNLQTEVMQMLDLPTMVSTQLTQPEPMARFYYELTLMSAALANFGDDVRHLQATEIGEVVSASSSSSAMSHKTANPVLAENVDGMHVNVRCEGDKVTQTLNSTLQRDLRGSNVMRAYNAVMVYTFQQLKTAERIFRSLKVDLERCRINFEQYARLSTAELLHTSLQLAGLPEAHNVVNKKVIPFAKTLRTDLCTAMDRYVKRTHSKPLKEAWSKVSEDEKIRHLIAHPELYLGDAVKIAKIEAMLAC
jgi:adenylosuccinate lyase